MKGTKARVKRALIGAYRSIATHYSQLKRKPWKDFVEYYNCVKERFNLPNSGVVVDAGTGNCRNLLCFKNKKWLKVGIDISFNLLKMCLLEQDSNSALAVADIINLPIRRKSVNLVLSIAVLHHLTNKEDVTKALTDMKKILAPGGFIILSVWRRWRPKLRLKMLLELLMYPVKKLKDPYWRHGDYYLPWHNKNKNVIGIRYYHLFTKTELFDALKDASLKVLDFSTLGGKSGRDNFFLLLTDDPY